MSTTKCSMCNRDYPTSAFQSAQSQHRQCRKCENCRAKSCAWKAKHRKRVQLYNQAYWQRTKEAQRPKKRAYARHQRATNPMFRVVSNMRTRLWSVLKGKVRGGHTMDMIGCSVDKLRDHLESKFTSAMSWENYGKTWHVDHIRPCASFDLSKPVQQQACFHWSNLQPLLALDNLRKGSKILNLGHGIEDPKPT